MLGNGGTRELLTQQASEVHHRGARPIARHDVLGLAGVVAIDQNDTTERLAVDFSDVVLDPAVVGIGPTNLNSWRSYNDLMVSTTDRTLSAPTTTPSNIEPSTVASSAMFSSHVGSSP